MSTQTSSSPKSAFNSTGKDRLHETLLRCCSTRHIVNNMPRASDSQRGGQPVNDKYAISDYCTLPYIIYLIVSSNSTKNASHSEKPRCTVQKMNTLAENEQEMTISVKSITYITSPSSSLRSQLGLMMTYDREDLFSETSS